MRSDSAPEPAVEPPDRYRVPCPRFVMALRRDPGPGLSEQFAGEEQTSDLMITVATVRRKRFIATSAILSRR